MEHVRDPLDFRLLNDWQRDLPLVPHPFAAIAAAEGTSEADVLGRLRRLSACGAVGRVGATCRPNAVGASTLAALAVPEARIETVCAEVARVPGVNHAYLREHRVNLWFVMTGPDRAHVSRALARIGQATGLSVLDLRLERAFNVDLGFSLDGSRPAAAVPAAGPAALRDGDRAIMQALSEGLALVPQPFAELAARLGRAETDILARVAALAAGGILSRVGVIVRHRALGWRSNAMVVWDLAETEADRIGPELARVPGVTLCYRRRAVPGVWPYRLYCMIHARSRPEALATLARARREAGLGHVAHAVLFSLRCFGQRGATVAAAAREEPA